MIIATTASLRYFNYTFLRTDVRNLWMGLCICAMGWSTETGNEEMGKWEKEEILHALLPGRVSNYRYVWSDFFLFLLTIPHSSHAEHGRVYSEVRDLCDGPKAGTSHLIEQQLGPL